MLMWAFVHVAHLVGWGNRFGTTVRWMWTLAARNRRERLIRVPDVDPPGGGGGNALPPSGAAR
jgi:hypothetical protein